MSYLSQFSEDALISPLYSIYRYTDSIYKIVKFKSQHPLGCVTRHEKVSNDSASTEPKKWCTSVSRACRRILELALCNPWDYFCTFTIGKENYDRYNLDAYYKDFSQFIRDQRKKSGDALVYLLVPELHEDGAWHIHGLFRGLSDLTSFAQLWADGETVPFVLAQNGYLRWNAYHAKFGFCSLAPVRDPVACGLYVTKYVGKGLSDDAVAGSHLYRASLGLNKAQKFVESWESNECLDYFLHNDYEFCRTGMTHNVDGVTWHDIVEWSGSVRPLILDDYGLEKTEVDYFMEAMQEVLEGFE